MSANDELQAHTCEKILQECGDVANNVAQGKVQDLTEQWKKGELRNDWYYIRTTNGIEKWEYIKQSHGFGYYETDWVLEVLAPVPSYEEYLESESHCAVYSIANKSLEKENQQLKELLKECHTQLLNKPIREIQYDIKMAELKDLLKRIYEAIK